MLPAHAQRVADLRQGAVFRLREVALREPVQQRQLLTKTGGPRFRQRRELTRVKQDVVTGELALPARAAATPDVRFAGHGAKREPRGLWPRSRKLPDFP